MKTIVLRVLLIFLLIEGALSAGLPRSDERHRSSESLSPSTSARRSPSSNAQQGKGPHTNRFERYTNFADLVNKRPYDSKQEAKIALLREHEEAFARHPDVQAIELHHHDKLRLAKETLQLRKRGQGSGWQRKLTWFLRSHLKSANVDDKTQDYIFGYHMDHNVQRNNKRQLAEQHRVDPGNEVRRRKAREFYHMKKDKIKATQRARSAFLDDLDRIIGSRRLSALDVERQAEVLRNGCFTDKFFDASLRAYLVKKRYPADEIALIRGARYLQAEKARLKRISARISSAVDHDGAFTSGTPTSPPDACKGSDRSQSTKPIRKQGKGKEAADESRDQPAPKRTRRIVTSRMQNPSTYVAGSASHSKTKKGSPSTLRRSSSKGKAAASLSTSSDTPSQPAASTAKSIDELECGAWWEGGCFDD